MDSTQDIEEATEWEHFRGGKFWHHAAAGAMAGVSEHLLMFPFDTIKTNLQALRRTEQTGSTADFCSKLKSNGMGRAIEPNMNYSVGGSLPSNAKCNVTDNQSTTTSTQTQNQCPKSQSTSKANFHSACGTLPASATGTRLNIQQNLINNVNNSQIPTVTRNRLSMRTAYQSIVAQDGYMGLYRGVSAMALGCIPAHVAYFGSYELTKAWVMKVMENKNSQEGNQNNSSSSRTKSDRQQNLDTGQHESDLPVGRTHSRGGSEASAVKFIRANSSTAAVSGATASDSSSSSGSSSSSSSDSNNNSSSSMSTWAAGTVAGAAAAFSHDLILTPLDTAKQRMQLGAYSTCQHCVREVIKKEGYIALYRSFPITLMSNVPFGSILIGVNETLKEASGLNTTCSSMEEMRTKLPMYFGLAGFSAAIAGFVTQPLDTLKTRLQTQGCLLDGGGGGLGGSMGSSLKGPADSAQQPHYQSIGHAAKRIFKEEGWKAFYRGSLARALVVIPSGAISWGTYELVKAFLVSNF